MENEEKNLPVIDENKEGLRHVVIGEMDERVERDRLAHEKKNKWKKFYSIHNVVFSILLLLLMIAAILTGDLMLYAAAIFCGIKVFRGINRLKNSKFPKTAVKAIVSAVITLVIILILIRIPGPISTENMKYYSLNKAWVCTKFNVDEDLFPEQLYGDGYYSLDTMPSILQGSGWVSLCSMFLPDVFEKPDFAAYIDSMTSKAVSSFKLSEYHDPDIGQELDKDHVSIYYKEAMWKNYLDDAVVYVLDSHGTGNHPHSTVIILDRKNGVLQVSRLG